MSVRSKIAVEVTVEHAAWTRSWPSLETDIPSLLRKAAAKAGRPAKGVVAVVLGGDARLRRLNRDFRGKDMPTNVLSFPDSFAPLGGIAIAYQTVKREAAAQQKIFINHAKHMILHGFLHLLGHDHVGKKDARLMEGIETAILSELGIPDPYVIEKPSA